MSEQPEDFPAHKENITAPTRRIGSIWALVTLIAFLTGSFGGFFVGDRRYQKRQEAENGDHTHQQTMEKLALQVNPPDGYVIPATFGDIGPRLIEAGAIDYDAFIAVYEQAGKPLTEQQIAILTGSSQEQVVINRQNAYFLLNFFWALGLANNNRILTEGPMVEHSQGRIESFASTGGWTLSTKPIKELYSGASLISLTATQQELLEHVAEKVYRPCCNNATHFPDCNHGMAMLGLLELMASQGANEDELFEAARYVTSFWYPNQALEVALLFKTLQETDFVDVDPRQVVNQGFMSASGYQLVRQWLGENGLLPQAPSGGGSCGV